MMTWDEIRAMPTTRNQEHESLYRCFHVLDEVTEMLDRGDSRETIRKFVGWAYVDGPSQFRQDQP